MVYSGRPDLKDSPYSDLDLEIFVDGSSSVNSDGTRQAGYAVVTQDEVLEAQPLPVGTLRRKLNSLPSQGLLRLEKRR